MTDPAPPPAPDLITVTPDPPKRGQEAGICYDWSQVENPPAQITLALHWDPSSITEPSTVTVSTSAPCQSITVPANAVGLTIVDESGVSADWGGTVGA